MHTVKNFSLVLLLFCVSGIANAQKTDTLRIFSNILKEEQEIWIARPDGYDSSLKRYPVLLALDGDALHEYIPMFVKYLSRPFELTVPPMLVVSIRSRSPVWRSANFIPKLGVDSLDSRPNRGKADHMLAFIKTELLPLIDTKYRSKDFRILAGHSLAGLFSIYALHKEPSLFRAVLALSPSPLNGVIGDTYVPSISAAKKDSASYLYLSVAGNDLRGYFEGSMAIKKALENQKSVIWKQEVFDNTTHWTTVPPAMYQALLWLFRQERLKYLLNR